MAYSFFGLPLGLPPRGQGIVASCIKFTDTRYRTLLFPSPVHFTTIMRMDLLIIMVTVETTTHGMTMNMGEFMCSFSLSLWYLFGSMDVMVWRKGILDECIRGAQNKTI